MEEAEMDQRQIDQWHLEAQEFAQEIQMKFMRSLMGKRNYGKVSTTVIPGAGGPVSDRQPAVTPAGNSPPEGELPATIGAGPEQLSGGPGARAYDGAGGNTLGSRG